ncbi:oxidoreductase [Leuconostoc pseudomesenteroides]|uniref:oxidoreductase n=1 Tax=Leuconostoc pseudomesenteroides TaxID=33968 RepID=UPI0021A6ECB0|nr:NADH-dependent flavin oxidoreductase, Oye family protein [Leuconostoc pseudomesenteroides]MCT4414009.1 NADH-dependent flavin oxidoreductase, Oye family protein [Leuconostoc pseudomesenteroides]
MNEILDKLMHGYNIGNRQLRNHFVMAPVPSGMVENKIMQNSIVDFYDSRSKDPSLIIIGAINVDSDTATNHAKIPYIRSNQDIQIWSMVNQKIHNNGAVSLAEIWHSGSSRAFSDYSDTYITPTKIHFGHNDHEMDIEYIQEMIDKFVLAGQKAKLSGFDGVDIHAAHGSFLHDFFFRDTNQRSDKYGYDTGSTIINEIVDRIKNEVGDDFIVGIRISNYRMYDLTSNLRSTEGELSDFLNTFSDKIDVFDVSNLHWRDTATENSKILFSKFVKQVTGKPVITVGQIGFGNNFYQDLPIILRKISDDPNQSLLDMQHEKSHFNNSNYLYQDYLNESFDMIAVGRPLLVNPNWISELEENSDK